MRFQYVSDIHLECYNGSTHKVDRVFISKFKKNYADVLLLAGDIGKPYASSTYKHLIHSLSPFYQKIFVTCGNHEYYTKKYNMYEVDEMCRNICQSAPNNNVVFLQNESYNISDTLSIFGGTFWTNIPSSHRSIVEHYMNDYKQIIDFTPMQSSQLHRQACNALGNLLCHKNDRKWIVMSHHIPSMSLIDPMYKDCSYNCAFASDVEYINHPDILAWVYGHTHKPLVQDKFYCNPVGYLGENKNWSLHKYFDLL